MAMPIEKRPPKKAKYFNCFPPEDANCRISTLYVV
jgi:hypothetical protein